MEDCRREEAGVRGCKEKMVSRWGCDNSIGYRRDIQQEAQKTEHVRQESEPEQAATAGLRVLSVPSLATGFVSPGFSTGLVIVPLGIKDQSVFLQTWGLSH